MMRRVSKVIGEASDSRHSQKDEGAAAGSMTRAPAPGPRGREDKESA